MDSMRSGGSPPVSPRGAGALGAPNQATPGSGYTEYRGSSLFAFSAPFVQTASPVQGQQLSPGKPPVHSPSQVSMSPHQLPGLDQPSLQFLLRGLNCPDQQKGPAHLQPVSRRTFPLLTPWLAPARRLLSDALEARALMCVVSGAACRRR